MTEIQKSEKFTIIDFNKCDNSNLYLVFSSDEYGRPFSIQVEADSERDAAEGVLNLIFERSSFSQIEKYDSVIHVIKIPTYSVTGTYKKQS